MDYSELGRAQRELRQRLFEVRHGLFASAYRQLQQQLKYYPSTWDNRVPYPSTWRGVYANGNLRVREYHVSIGDLV